MERNSLLKAFVSFIIPGLGQALSGYKTRGILFFTIAVLLNILIYFTFNNSFGSIIARLYGLYAAYDTYKLS